MRRVLQLKISPYKDGGLELVVVHQETDGDSEHSETHATRDKDPFASNSAVKQAIESAVALYFGKLKQDDQAAVAKTPIGKAIARETEARP